MNPKPEPPRPSRRAIGEADARHLSGFSWYLAALRAGGLCFSWVLGPTWMSSLQVVGILIHLAVACTARRWSRDILMAVTGIECIFWGTATLVAYGFQSSFWLHSVYVPLGTALLLRDVTWRQRLGFLTAPILLPIPPILLFATLDPGDVLSPQQTLTVSLFNQLLGIAFLILVTFLAMREMSRAREQAERLALDRARLIEDLSHEVRTPLATVLTAAQGAKLGDEMPDSAHRAFGWIESATRSATRLVERMLDLAALEDRESPDASTRNLAEVNLADVNVAEVVDAAVERMRPVAAAAEVDLAFEVDGEISLRVDATSLDIVLHNLISNAVSHSAPGDLVTVRLAREGRRTRIEVVDEGDGIAEADLPFVFDRLWRADRARSRAAGRFGLGLAIARRHAELLGAVIRVESTLGDGSCFTVEFEARRSVRP